jgi:hypothetical protein
MTPARRNALGRSAWASFLLERKPLTGKISGRPTENLRAANARERRMPGLGRVVVQASDLPFTYGPGRSLDGTPIELK